MLNFWGMKWNVAVADITCVLTALALPLGGFWWGRRPALPIASGLVSLCLDIGEVLAPKHGRAIRILMYLWFFAHLPLAIAYHPQVRRNSVGPDGICHQSTGFTCAASAVTLLHLWGIRATEGEIVRLTHATPHGIDDFSLAQALSRKGKAEGLDVAFFPKLDFKTLLKINLPAVVGIRRADIPEHSVVLLAVRDGEVVIADPLRGKLTETREGFESEWLKTAIVLAPLPLHTLKRGDKGKEVALVQGLLRQAGFLRGPVTGEVDDAILEAVQRFQISHGLKATGKIDPLTILVLAQSCGALRGPKLRERGP